MWRGCRLAGGGQRALMGCTVVPGFDYADFELGSRAKLLMSNPKFAEMIVLLTRD
jgi:predicted cupin superfamily sugar epimerase